MSLEECSAYAPLEECTTERLRGDKTCNGRETFRGESRVVADCTNPDDRIYSWKPKVPEAPAMNQDWQMEGCGVWVVVMFNKIVGVVLCLFMSFQRSAPGDTSLDVIGIQVLLTRVFSVYAHVSSSLLDTS